MTREDIIMRDDTEHGVEYVRADEVQDYLNKAIAAEREACAKVCDEVESLADDLWNKFANPEDQGITMGASRCAAAIRTRR